MRIPFVLLFLLILASDCKKTTLSPEKELLKIWITDRDGNFKIPLHGTGCEYPGIATVLNPDFLELAAMERLKLEMELSPGAKSEPESGILMDFNEPISLKVTAEDGTDTTYQVVVGYVEGQWYRDSGMVEAMKFRTYCFGWTAEESIVGGFDHLVIGFGAAGESDSDANGFHLGNWARPDTITTALVFDLDSTNIITDFRTRTIFGFWTLKGGEGKLVFTQLDRQTHTVSGFWDIQFYPTVAGFYRSTGSFRNVYLDAK